MRKVQLLLACLVFSVAAFAADKVIKLPKPNLNRTGTVMKALSERHSTREFASKALNLSDLSDLLWAANGINRSDSGKRTAPSALNKQDVDVYVVLPEGSYLYDAKNLSYYFAGGNTAGAIVKWFRNTLCQWEIENQKNGGPNLYDVLNGQAEQIPAGSEGLVVLPYFMGERSPIWDSDAKGTIVGLSLAHTKGHIYRAFLEAVAYCLRDAMEATGSDLGDHILIAGGVTKSKVWRQIFADVTGYPVVCPIYDVEANMGDVMLAGIGTGLLTYEEVKKWQVLDDKIMPNKEAHEKYNEYFKLYKSIYQHLKEDMKQLTKIR